jgi:streptogramin lyase
VQLPEVGLGVQFEGNIHRSASVISQNAAFYPNVAEETDLSILPTPTGLETFTQLRSPKAPRTQKIRLDLPAGAALRKTDDGGAVIDDQSEEALVVVRPPTAIDANGAPISVKMEVSGSSLLLNTQPDEDAAYPILVDPVFESYSWMNSENKTGIYEDWRPYTSNSNVFKPGWIGTIGGQFRFGLALRSSAGATSPGTSMSWNYYVPRYFTDNILPTSYIKNITLSQAYFVLEDSPIHSHPYLMYGLWDENKGEFASYGQRGGLEGAYNGVTMPLTNPYEFDTVKNGGFALATYESASYPRQAFVGSASVEVTDHDLPVWEDITSVTQWMSSQTGNIPYEAADAGLGIHALRIRYAAARGGQGEGMITIGCTGTASSACPRTSSTATKSFLFDAGAIAQGENWVNLYAVDPVGHWSEVGTSRIKVDREPPELGLSGNLTEQKSVGTTLSQYSLKLDVKDGDEATAAATTPVGTAGTGTGQLERPMGVEADAAGNIWVTDRTNNRIAKYSPNGVYLSQITGIVGTENQVTEPRDLAISANGNIWVAETTYNRVRQYSPTGTIVSTIKSGEMESPFGVAVAPDGAIWVTDNLNNKVLQFKQDGTLIRKITRPSGSTDIPFGLDIDEYGNGWIAMQGSNRVVEMSPAGTQLFAFGSEGTEDGKFKAPYDVAIAPSGNLFVTDSLNNRIQEFKPDGGFMRKFGTTGTASNQLQEPRGIAVLPGNGLAIADAANKRVARWTHADRHIESGAVKTEIKVDGTLADTYNPGCAAGKNCSLSREWVMKADSYSVGSHKVDVIATDGAGIKSEKSLTVETHGDLQAPAVALSGTMTEQASLGNTRPTYKLKASATDPGSAEERKCGVASTSIKVDGVVVDSSSPGCPSGGCSITREWTLNSSSYTAGNHTVEVKATDAAGRTTTKTLTVKVERDTTAPEMALSGTLPGAPEGWVQQVTRNTTIAATDQNGYGVKLIKFTIDGATIGETTPQTCELGGCPKSVTFSADMSKYDGGAHPAVVTVEDLAANVRKRSWTINVDPEGNISDSEAEDTLEALDATSPVNTVGPSESEADYEGTMEGLKLAWSAGNLIATGGAAPTQLDASDPGSFTVEVTTPEYYGSCSISAKEGGDAERSGAEEEALAAASSCPGFTAINTGASLQPIMVTAGGGIAGEDQSLSANGASAVAGNVSPGVDLVTRPLIDGTMIFTAIRDSSGPTEYEWHVHVHEDQELKLVDPQHAQVVYKNGPTAFSITAVKAHDAIGTTVPTSIRVAGNSVILAVNHRQNGPTGAPFVYPVVAGTGWEGGFRTVEVHVETEEEASGEVTGSAIEGYHFVEANFGPPEVGTYDGEPALVQQYSSLPTRKRKYNFRDCAIPPDGQTEPGKPPEPLPPKAREEMSQGCHGAYQDGYFKLKWGVSVHGWYYFKPHKWVWIKNAPQCEKWGPGQLPALVHCLPPRDTMDYPTFPHLDVIGDYRFVPGSYTHGYGQEAVCFRINGVLPTYWKQDYPGEKVLMENMHKFKGYADVDEKCDWGHLHIA